MNQNLYKKQKELIIKFQIKKEDRAVLILLKSYEGLIVNISNKMTKKFIKSPLAFDDYFQYLSFCFIERTKKYRLNSRMNYSSYIEKFLNLDANNYAKKYLTTNHKSMNYSNLINYEDSNKYFYEDVFNFGFKDLDTSSLRKDQIFFFKVLIKNGGDVKKTSQKMNIPLKTVYRHRSEIIKKLNKINRLN